MRIRTKYANEAASNCSGNCREAAGHKLKDPNTNTTFKSSVCSAKSQIYPVTNSWENKTRTVNSQQIQMSGVDEELPHYCHPWSIKYTNTYYKTVETNNIRTTYGSNGHAEILQNFKRKSMQRFRNPCK